MSIMNFVQIIFFIVVAVAGSLIKWLTGRRVEELDGVGAIVKKKEEYRSGRIEGKFGE